MLWLVFCVEILIGIKKIDLTTSWDVLKLTWLDSKTFTTKILNDESFDRSETHSDDSIKYLM